MILVILGTQDKKFYRLLEAVDKEIKNKNIKEKVIVQAGFSSDYQSNNMEIFDLIDVLEFDKLIKKSSLIITHGGVGSILSGITNNKKVIAMPRLKKYNEHTNDHQLEIVSKFREMGYILSCNEKDNLNDVLMKTKNFKPKKFVNDNIKMKNIIEEFIENN